MHFIHSFFPSLPLLILPSSFHGLHAVSEVTLMPRSVTSFRHPGENTALSHTHAHTRTRTHSVVLFNRWHAQTEGGVANRTGKQHSILVSGKADVFECCLPYTFIAKLKPYYLHTVMWENDIQQDPTAGDHQWVCVSFAFPNVFGLSSFYLFSLV